MCGICGIVSKNPFDPQIIQNMNDSLIHRGPNGEGFYKEDGIALGMRRLSVIDLKRGWQPIYNEDKSVVLMINGEIYNYIELREQLIKKGHKFSTQGDGETIVHLYEEYGINCLNYLRGMFAFALLDKNQNKLFVARDRMGEKPLYYFNKNNQFIFSSELRSLLSSKQMEFELDPFSIDLFFHYHYIPEPYTPVKFIHKLPAAHYVSIELESMKTTLVNYWKMEDAPALTSEPIETLKDKFEEIGKLIIRSDVSVGVALSGGIDSSMVAAIARKHYGSNLHAISVGYEGNPESDERKTASRIAQQLGIHFHSVEITTKNFIDNFPTICCLTDDPIADISAFGYYNISKTAKNLGIPVILQGQGGDELFWGYNWVRENYKYSKLKNAQLNNRKLMIFDYYKQKFNEQFNRSSIKSLVKGILSINKAIKLKETHASQDKEVFPLFDYFSNFNWTNNKFESFYGNYILKEKTTLDAYLPFKVKQPWDKPEIILTKLICNTYLLENGMAQGDRLSMSNSVEMRLPFVDHKFVETVIGLRKTYNDINFEPKYWLKESGKELLPEWIFKLRKRGFEPPVQEWFKGILKNYGESLAFGNLTSKGILNKKMAEKLALGYFEPSPVFPSYFSALVLEQWYTGIKNMLN